MAENKREPELKDEITPHALRIQDLFVPDGMEAGSDRLFLGSDFTCTYALHALPRMVQVGWLDEILGVGDVDLSVHFTPASDKDVVRVLLGKETRARSQLYIDQKSGNISRIPELEAQVADYSALRDAVQLGQDKLYYLTFLVTVHAGTSEDLRGRCDVVESVLSRKGVHPRKLVFRQLEGLQNSLPLARSTLCDFERNLTSGAAACCLPLSVAGGGHAGGVMVGVNLFTRTPIFLDRFAGERLIPNPHLGIFGETGSGKSVTKRQIMLLEGYEGIRAADIDPEGEDVHCVQSLGGQVIHLRPGKFSGMNPLEVEPELDENERWSVNILAKIEDVRALVGSVYRYYNQQQGMDVVDASLLEEAVREDYKERGITSDPDSLYDGDKRKLMPTLTSIRDRLLSKPNARRLADAMTPLLDGGSVGMFDGQTTVHLANAPLICFDLSGLDGEFPRFVAVCAVLAWLWQTFAQKGGKSVPKSVVVDEAWMFMRHPDGAKHLETLARRGRKHGCGLIIATQKFEEFTGSKEGRAVIDSCASLLIMRQEEHAVGEVIDYFKLASGCSGILSRAKAGQGILCTSSGSATALQVQPAPFEWEYVETKLRRR